MGIVKRFSAILRNFSPAQWQYIKYLQYLGNGEREIHIIEKFVDPERTALDVGVHLGFYTRHLAKCARDVIGFEANPDSAAFATVALWRVAKIVPIALSDTNGFATLRVPIIDSKKDQPALGTIASDNPLAGRETRSVNVPSQRLDDIKLPPLGFIKIDVEGHEEAVLHGAADLIARDHPNFLIEIEERHNSGALRRIRALLEPLGYRAHFYKDGLQECREDFDINANQVIGSAEPYINNFLFVHDAYHRLN